MNKQRDAIYSLRRRILEGKQLKEKILEMVDKVLDVHIDFYLNERGLVMGKKSGTIRQVQMVALSASAASTDARKLGRQSGEKGWPCP